MLHYLVESVISHLGHLFHINHNYAPNTFDVLSVCGMKNDVGKILSDAEGIKDTWRKYMERLLNVENEWGSKVGGPEVMGPLSHF